MLPNPRSESLQLARDLRLLDSIFIVMGVMIGSGIFLTTGVMAETLPSPTWLMAAWALGGLLTLAGALSFGELGAAMPDAGGQYIYLREAYGPLPGFLFGWISFLIYQSGGIAAVSMGFAVYFGYLFPVLGTDNVLATSTIAGYTFVLTAAQLVAPLLILGLTAANVRGVRLGSLVQNVSTTLKIAALGLFVLLGSFSSSGHDGSWLAANDTPSGFGLLSAFGVSLIGVLWAYDGVSNLNFSAGEMKNPARTLPRALIIGTIGVMVIYLLTNAVYFKALPIGEMRGVTRVADGAAAALFGPGATLFVVVAVLISTFGATNGSILTAARIYYAMAKDGVFFRAAARVHPRFRTPSRSLWLQGAWACVLALSGTFEQLFTYSIFGALMLYCAAAASLFTLRRQRPDLPRPYRAWGYPLVPGLFLAGLLAILLNTLFERPLESLVGLVLLGLGLPVYALWRRGAGEETDQQKGAEGR